jgi:pimeloyl-ACP methyl ester carboxylesterase
MSPDAAPDEPVDPHAGGDVDGTRFDVRSPDGTPIAVWAGGDGPPLVLVHGGLNDHTTDRPFVAELRRTFTTFAMDRRGRGASGDAPAYAIEREFEDVAAVVDAVAARTGGAVSLWGHSYGADCAMGAATLSGNVAHLVLYEPGLGVTCSDEVLAAIEAVDAAVAAGDLEGALLTALRDVVELTEDEVAFVRSGPAWPARLAAVPVLPREIRAEVDWVYGPGRFDGVTAATLLLAGADSPAAQQDATRRAAGAIRGARIRVLDGHGHIAHRTDPALVAGILAEVLRP